MLKEATHKLTLQAWLDELEEPKPETIDFSFPNDAVRDEFIATIEGRDWDEVANILRKFL